MNVTVHTKHTVPTLNPAAEEQQKITVVDRIEKALKHVASRVRDVEVYLEDETPASAKFDGKCRITVHFIKGEPLTVEGHGESFHDTLAKAVAKVQQAAGNSSKKRIEKRRRAAPAME